MNSRTFGRSKQPWDVSAIGYLVALISPNAVSGPEFEIKRLSPAGTYSQAIRSNGPQQSISEASTEWNVTRVTLLPSNEMMS